MGRKFLTLGFFIFICLFLNGFGAKWTVMVYLDGDNDLEEFAINDFLEMASIGSNENVNIVVQFDRINGYDRRFDNWTECNRFYVTYGMIPTRANSIKNWGDGIGGREVNMGDPQTLIDFINWAKINYPAEKYALILWNHGSGWRTISILEEIGKKRIPYKEVCYDDTSNDYLSMKEVRSALSNNYFDLIGFDACLMGMIEVATEIKEFANIFVSSESPETTEGWNYTGFLLSLKNNPNATAEELTFYIINSTNQETLAGIKLNKIGQLNQKLNQLLNEIINLNDYLPIFLAREETLIFDSEFADIYNFWENYYLIAENYNIKNLIEEFQIIFNQAVICDKNPNDKAYGLTIYFPSYFSSIDPGYNENTIIFPKETMWDEFLYSFFSSNLFEGYIKIFSEDFSNGLPSNWEIIDGFNDGFTWMSQNPKNRRSPYLTEPFMIVDSDWAGNKKMDEQLISKSFNFPNYKKIYLKFSHKFWYYSNETADLDIKIEEENWKNLKRWQGYDDERVVIIDISNIVRGKNNVKFRWHYYDAYYDWFWAIDNVEILIKGERQKGDINGDFIIDIIDVILCLRMAIGLDPENLEFADMDGNGQIDITDVIKILRKAISFD